MKILFFRRAFQVVMLLLFVAGNFYGFSVLKGNLSSSVLFDVVPLSDPFAVLQLFLAGMGLSINAIMGAVLVLVFYALVAPRAFCSWVCPLNLFTDIAYKLRHKFGFNKDKRVINLSKNTRYYLLVFTLVISFVLGIAAFESISFVGIIQRGIVFLQGFALAMIFCVIVFDMFLFERGICSHLCPLGAFYAVVSKFSLIRVKHSVDKCIRCGKCKLICPEVQVLDMIGKRDDVVRDSECISCGRCVDVCDDDALSFSIINLRREK